MRQLRAFRPWLSDALEARAVPATLGVTTPIGLLGINVTLPNQVPTTSPAVQKAFATFDQSYIDAVDNILNAPNASGLVIPSANRAAFDSAIEQSLETLAQQLVLSVTSTGSTTSTSTTATTSTSSVSSQVVAAIVGSSSASLESQLQAVSTSTIQLNLANVTSVGATTSTVVANIVSTAEEVRPTNRVPVAESTGSSTFLADTTALSSSSSSATKAANDVRSAFGNFLNDYFQAVQNTLLAAGANGQVNLAANRAAFDTQVSQALQTLETRLSTALSRYPATTGLGPQIQAALVANDASSLKIQLAKLATPTGSSAAVVRDFTLGSTQAIAQALSLLSGDVARLVAPASN